MRREKWISGSKRVFEICLSQIVADFCAAVCYSLAGGMAYAKQC